MRDQLWLSVDFPTAGSLTTSATIWESSPGSPAGRVGGMAVTRDLSEKGHSFPCGCGRCGSRFPGELFLHLPLECGEGGDVGVDEAVVAGVLRREEDAEFREAALEIPHGGESL